MNALKEGISYPKARELVIKKYIEDIDSCLMSEPNNILAIEYLRKIRNLEPITIKRQGLSHHVSDSSNISSIST